MIIIIGLFGFVSMTVLFVASIMLFTLGETLLGVSLLLSAVYILALTIILIRLDGEMTSCNNRIIKLESQVERLCREINIDLIETSEEEVPENDIETDEVPIDTPNDGQYCPTCGYQIFPEDEVCPFCHEKIDKDTHI